MAFDVNSLKEYISDNREKLIGKIATRSCTLDHIGSQYGIKFKEALHLIDVNAVVQDGKSCSFDPQGNATFTDKEIEVAPLKVNMEFCDKDLREKWTQYQIKTAAKKEAMPFEEKIVEEITNDIEKYLEEKVWQGSKANGDPFDGFLTLMENDNTINKVELNGSTAYDRIKQMILALPQAMVDNGAVIYIGKDLYRENLADLEALNLYHYSEEETADGIFSFPAFSTKIIPVNGLNDTNKMVAALADHLIYGTELDNDNEVIDI